MSASSPTALLNALVSERIRLIRECEALVQYLYLFLIINVCSGFLIFTTASDFQKTLGLHSGNRSALGKLTVELKKMQNHTLDYRDFTKTLLLCDTLCEQLRPTLENGSISNWWHQLQIFLHFSFLSCYCSCYC